MIFFTLKTCLFSLNLIDLELNFFKFIDTRRAKTKIGKQFYNFHAGLADFFSNLQKFYHMNKLLL